MVGPAPRHYTGPPGGGAQLEHMDFEFFGNCLDLGAVLGTGGQASQIRSESAQTLRRHTDIALVQLPAHIANPANTQRVGSDVATQIIDLEVRSADGEELGCEPSRADSDNRHKAAAGAP